MATTVPGAERLHLAGLTATVLADGPGTGGRYLLADVTGARGARVPSHVHANEDEWLLVLDGELRVRVDGGERLVGPAEPVVLPRGVPHAVAVVSERARFLTLWDPAGLEDMLRLLADPAPDARPLPRDDVAALLARGGVTLV
jgi:quercetin dioxygenase-like cupin family protein